MKKILLTALVLMACLSASAEGGNTQKVVNQVDFSHVRIADDFWSPRLERHVTATLPTCIDQIENQTGRIQNFINAGRGEGRHSGIFFDDSDVYKAMEGMAYSLVNHPDKALEAKLDQWIDYMETAQREDGYINTYYTLTGLDKRWTDMDRHEMYCAGHMIEGAVAYYLATGKDKFLKVCERMADHMMSIFGPGKRHWVPGHEEIELALVKLYETTGEEKYLNFAYWLLEERGHGHGIGPNGPWNKVYYQDEVPLRNLENIGGHAVRLMYLFCGMADITAYKQGTGYMEALDELWHDVVDRNMYITGGIGQTATNEGFSEDYSLPNASAYCETCASIGMVLWNYRMNQFSGEAKYIDVLERAMYNGVLAGVNLEGDRFFYVNPLEADGNHHRQAWFGCACCPSNVSRFLPSVGNYVYGTSRDALYVNLYIGNEASLNVDGKQVSLAMNTQYPWDGTIRITFRNGMDKALKMRIPGWCKAYKVTVNGKPSGAVSEEKGYAKLSRKWKKGDVVELQLAMPVEKVAADERVKEDKGKRAIQRGPLVYCAEAIDNAGTYDSFRLSSTTRFALCSLGGMLQGMQGITADNGREVLRLIPYYAWDNRDASKMKVWIDTDE
ncbi:MAG: glycoside hydrolase family 127 protein [Prevotella sp.]|nr:glycoside hydrolase family 127 protein [Prevotella sp.]